MLFQMKCPHCGKDTYQNKPQIIPPISNLTVEAHQCLHCRKPIIFILEKSEVLLQFPKKRFEKMPERVQNLSPNATRVFEQTLQATTHNLTEFLGIGLRKSYEILLFDYLTRIRNIPEKQLKNLTLSQMAKLMEDSLYAHICDVILRLYGNDTAHRNKKHPSLTFEDALKSFLVLCETIDGEMRIKEARAKLNR